MLSVKDDVVQSNPLIILEMLDTRQPIIGHQSSLKVLMKTKI